MCCDGQHFSSEAPSVLSSSDKVHFVDQKLSGTIGDPQACSNLTSKPSEVEGSIESSMDVEKDRG
jgi:hypothetical protein